MEKYKKTLKIKVIIEIVMLILVSIVYFRAIKRVENSREIAKCSKILEKNKEVSEKCIKAFAKM